MKKIESLKLYREDCEEEVSIDRINYLYISDGVSRGGEPFTLAQLDGKECVWSDFEAFDTMLFSGTETPAPFLRLETRKETINQSGSARVTLRTIYGGEAEQGRASVLINPGRIDYRLTRRRNPVRRRSLYEIVFKDGTVLQLHGDLMQRRMPELFGLPEDRLFSPFCVNVGKHTFSLVDVDRIEYKPSKYKNGSPFMSIKIIFKDGSCVSWYSLRIDDFSIDRWMRGAGIPAGQFRKEGCVRTARHRWQLPKRETLPARIR